MLSQGQAEELGKRLEELHCVDASAANGLFTYVLKGEPGDQKHHYEKHVLECDYCRVALEIFRYQRDVIHLLNTANDRKT
jgi:hypothetical protein